MFLSSLTQITTYLHGEYMAENYVMSISVPTDEDGFLLLQCEHCGTFFKATPSDIEDDGVLDMFCPSCGLTSTQYLTEDILELAQAMVTNRIMDAVHKQFKTLERQTRKGPISFCAGKAPVHEHENPIYSGIEALDIVTFPCCKRTAKIKPLLRMTGCYCLFCGVKNYELEA